MTLTPGDVRRLLRAHAPLVGRSVWPQEAMIATPDEVVALCQAWLDAHPENTPEFPMAKTNTIDPNDLKVESLARALDMLEQRTTDPADKQMLIEASETLLDLKDCGRGDGAPRGTARGQATREAIMIKPGSPFEGTCPHCGGVVRVEDHVPCRVCKIDLCARCADEADCTAILAFRGRWVKLGNYSPCLLFYEGHAYQSVEHAYQAQKTGDATLQAEVRHAPSPAIAKRLARRLPLRPDWEAIKIDLMRTLLREKFASEPERSILLATGLCLLVEGNWWGDRFWGQDPIGVGENWLGRLLMEVRAELRAAHGL